MGLRHVILSKNSRKIESLRVNNVILTANPVVNEEVDLPRAQHSLNVIVCMSMVKLKQTQTPKRGMYVFFLEKQGACHFLLHTRPRWRQKTYTRGADGKMRRHGRTKMIKYITLGRFLIKKEGLKRKNPADHIAGLKSNSSTMHWTKRRVAYVLEISSTK